MKYAVYAKLQGMSVHDEQICLKYRYTLSEIISCLWLSLSCYLFLNLAVALLMFSL